MKITIWSDFACPFCYIGETQLENVLRDRGMIRDDGSLDGVELCFRAYELDPQAPKVPQETMAEHFASSHDLTEKEALSQMDRISRMASRLGLEYDLAGVKVCSTFDAHRLMKYAIAGGDPAMALRLQFALFEANFKQSLCLADHKVLEDIAARAGLDRGEVAELLGSDRYSAEVRADEAEAESRGLEFIPYLLFDNGEHLEGVFSVGALKKLI